MSTRLPSSEKEMINPRALHALYEEDEVAWLEIMARLVAERRHEKLDYENLSEFLESMANHERQDVYDRLVKLLMHQLKWSIQDENRSRAWQRMIIEQRLRLRKRLESDALRDYVQKSLDEAYQEAVTFAMIETGLERTRFPTAPPSTIEEVLKDDEEPWLPDRS